MAQRQGSGNQIDLTQVSVQGLQELRKQLRAEVEALSRNYSSFKMAQSKLIESEKAVAELTEKNHGKDILVPLTQSLYVPGQLDTQKDVLVDVGTGYFFEKTPDQVRCSQRFRLATSALRHVVCMSTIVIAGSYLLFWTVETHSRECGPS